MNHAVVVAAIRGIAASCTMIGVVAAADRATTEEPALRGVQTLDNSVIRLGVDLDRGGAVTHLAPSGSGDAANLVNNFDRGRQIQMSFYSGPVPYVVGEKRPVKHWEHLGWNPIQAGDDFGHGGRILDVRIDRTRHEAYVRCIPLQWPLDDVPAECEFESWIRLVGPTAECRARLTNRRSDRTQYPARHQELPAVYVNGPYHRLFSYTGSAPFTDGALEQVPTSEGRGFPWKHVTATENWCALVRDDDFGLGVIHPGCYEFACGFSGPTGRGGTRDAPTGYIAPVRREILDHDATYEYRYTLVVGTLDEIRAQAQLRSPPEPRRPDYRFHHDRRHWTLTNMRDAGLPFEGEWVATYTADDPHLTGPLDFWQATDAPKFYITAGFRQSADQARLYWRRHGQSGFSEACAMDFPVRPDGVVRTYEVDLAQHQEYRGAVVALRLDPTPTVRAGDELRLRRIAAEP